jgi:hypothetical protein
MSGAPQTILNGGEVAGPWTYSARIPEGASSRNYAFIPFLVAFICGGMGAFLANDVARNTPFWSNIAVWVTLGLSATSMVVGIWMFLGHWVWTAPQMALFSLAGFAPIFWAFQGASFSAFFLYSNAPALARSALFSGFLLWHAWWIFRSARRCMALWSDVELREKVWIPYDCATVYRQFAAKAALDAKGVALHPGPLGISLPMVTCIPLYIYRHELVAYLDVPLLPMIGAVLGLSVFVLITTALTISVVAMLVIPARIVATSGKPVLVDMMTPASAAKP